MSHSLCVPVREPARSPKLRVIAIIQARMGSSRFPGKTLASLNGRPVLAHVVERVRQAASIEDVVVATSELPVDDPIATHCAQAGVSCFRGNESDVLDRFYQAAKQFSADVVVRVTADCPLMDGKVIDKVVTCFLDDDLDYASNVLRYTYPDGLDAEVFSFAALETAWTEATKPSEREHVTPYLRSGKFRVRNVESEKPVKPGLHRWTVDYPADLEFVQALQAKTGPRSDFESLLEAAERDVKRSEAANICNEGYYRSLFSEVVPGAAPPLKLTNSHAWLARSLKVIPGGAQTFSKKYTQYVHGAAPIFLERGQGCRVTDVDGNQYIDFVQGLLPNILGYAHPEVNAAVSDQLSKGHSFSLSHTLEVELAERLTRLIPCAEMVRFGKNGSDVTSGAIRASRALTGRERVACCGYHGWQDWYIGSTARNGGVPGAVRNLTHSFKYNDLSSLAGVLQQYPDEFAAVIMEPFNFEEPKPGFLEGVQELTHKHGALLVFDEICSGFHFGLGGAQKLFGVTPDMACFGKAMANGFPLSCVVGRADVMKIFDEIFFSFTFAGEVSSIAAAMKVLDILESTDALARIESNGRVIQDAVQVLSREAGLEQRIKIAGRPQWSLLKFLDSPGTEDPVLKNLFQQEAVKRGLLILATHNMTAAHDSLAVQETIETYAKVFKTLSIWIQDSNPARFLEGQMSRPVFRVR